MFFSHLKFFCKWVESWHSIKKTLTGKWQSTVQKSSNLFRWKTIIPPRNLFMKRKTNTFSPLWFDSLCSIVKKSWNVESLKPASVYELSLEKLYETKHVIYWLRVGVLKVGKGVGRERHMLRGWRLESRERKHLGSLLPANFSFKNKFLQLANSPQQILIVRMNTYQK